MIYLRDSKNNTYSFDGHIVFKNDVESYSYHIPFTAQNYARSLGLKLQEITIKGYVANRTDILFDDIVSISFDNWTTSQTVFTLTNLSFESVFTGAYIPFVASYVISPLRLGASYSSDNLWGLASTTLTSTGNKKATVKLTYYAPRFFFPLTQNLLDFAGSVINFTNPSSRTYQGISYSANIPIFDNGLYIGSGDVATLNIPNYTTGMLFLTLRYNAGTGLRTILKNTNFELQIDPTNAVIKLIQGINTIQTAYNTTTYQTTPLFIGLSWTSTSTTLAVGSWSGSGFTTPATATGSFGLSFGDTYIGSNGTGNWLVDIITNLTIFDYTWDNWLYATYNFTLEPLKFVSSNNEVLYIANKTAGTIIWDGVKLIDENGNDVTGLVSGTPLIEGTIQLADGLSAKWNCSIQDTYFP